MGRLVNLLGRLSDTQRLALALALPITLALLEPLLH